LKRLARLGSTFFAWGSALAVAACGALACGGLRVEIMAAPGVESFGLVYSGVAGALLAFAEAAFVVLAWRAARRPGTLGRGLGRAVLVAWALLWSVNALRWSALEPEPGRIAVVVVVLVGLACTALAALGRGAAPRE